MRERRIYSPHFSQLVCLSDDNVLAFPNCSSQYQYLGSFNRVGPRYMLRAQKNLIDIERGLNTTIYSDRHIIGSTNILEFLNAL
ncbi:MAG: hypothetical protein ACFFD2_10145 [Promethearchaeota archaeon]